MMKDPLAKTPADKLVIARQKWLQAKKRLNEHNEQGRGIGDLEHHAKMELDEAINQFDKTYG